MICSQDNCQKEITGDPICVMFGDVTKGNFWGNYCSYDCLIPEVTGAFLHLKQGKALASYVVPQNINELMQNFAQTFPDLNADAQGQILINTAPLATTTITVPTFQAPTTLQPPAAEDELAFLDEDDEGYGDDPIQADQYAWGTETPEVEIQAVNQADPIADGIEAVRKYSLELENLLLAKFNNLIPDAVTKEGTFNEATYEFSSINWTIPIDGYNLSVECYPRYENNNVILIMDIAKKPNYGLKVNVENAPVADLAQAVFKHFKTVVVPLKEAANANTAVGANNGEPF